MKKLKVWAVIDLYDSDHVTLHKDKKSVYRAVQKDYDDVPHHSGEPKVNSKNLHQIAEYIGLLVKQIEVQ